MSRMKLGPPCRKRINRRMVDTSQPTCMVRPCTRKIDGFDHRFVSPWMVPKGGYLEQFCQLNLTFLIYFIYFINIIYLICFAMFCNCRYQATSSALCHLNLSNCGRRPALITATSEPFTEESAQRLLNIAPKKLEASGLRRFTRQVSYRLSAKHWISTVMAIYQLLVISGIIHSINGVISTYNW